MNDSKSYLRNMGGLCMLKYAVSVHGTARFGS